MPNPHQRRSHEELAAAFHHFAQHRCGTYAPLYARLGTGIATDPGLLTIAAHAPPGQSPPDLMLAAVHYLLARESTDPLAHHYPTLTSQPARGDTFPLFRDFCQRHHNQLTALIATRHVQTNEVRRCCYLLPVVMLAAHHAQQPLALIEPGASTGLNLALDRYAYDYGIATSLGPADAPFTLRCQLRGHNHPPLHLTIPTSDGGPESTCTPSTPPAPATRHGCGH